MSLICSLVERCAKGRSIGMMRSVWLMSLALLVPSTVDAQSAGPREDRSPPRRESTANSSQAMSTTSPSMITVLSAFNLRSALVANTVQAVNVATGETHIATTAEVVPTQTTSTSEPQRSTQQNQRESAPTTRHGRVPRVAPPCVGPTVEITRLHSRASYRGPLVDCHGRPMFAALAAMATVASPNAANEHWTPELAPITSALRRALPALRWNVAESSPPSAVVASCPRGQEEVPATGDAATSVPQEGRSPRSARRLRNRPRIHCRRIEVAQDQHTHDPLIEVEGRVRVIHPRLLEVLHRVTQHWPGHRIEIVSGYRPSHDPHAGTRHAHARALDFRVVGVARESLRDFVRTLPLLGVGYYPHSVFVHVDIRDANEGSARWTDYSEPGERPRYGHWPPRANDVAREVNHITSRVNEALEDAEQNENAGRERPANESPSSETPAVESDQRAMPSPVPTQSATE